jgi:putative hemolysin
MREITAKNIMIPRAKMLAASIDTEFNVLLKILSDSTFSRIPIFEDSIDHIIGEIHIRNLLSNFYNTKSINLRDLIHPIPFVSENMASYDLFNLLQKEQHQMAIILDEFGGTSGMVTLEDLLEVVFGDLHDEFDSENPRFSITEDSIINIRGDVSIKYLNKLLGTNFNTEYVKTIGGLLLSKSGKIPAINEVIELNGIAFKIISVKNRSIQTISFQANNQQLKAVEEIINA